MSEVEIVSIVISTAALSASAFTMRRSARTAAALDAERIERLSASKAAEAAAQLVAGRIEGVERRVGRGRRVTPEKRERALELLALGAEEGAIARELELREAEVAVLARLRNRLPVGAA